MKTRIVHTKVWKDRWFVQLSPEAKFLWMYLLSNEKTNISGVFELEDREILFDTSIDPSLLEGVKKELNPKALFSDGWVRIMNVQRYNKYLNSPMNVEACITELTYIPARVKSDLQIPDDTSLDTLINKKQELKIQEKETGNKETPEEKAERARARRETISKMMKWGY